MRLSTVSSRVLRKWLAEPKRDVKRTKSPCSRKISCFFASQDLREPGMQKIEARIAGDVIAADFRKKTLEVLLLSFAPEKQIVDVLEGLAEDAAVDVIFAGAVGEALLAHDREDMPGAAN